MKKLPLVRYEDIVVQNLGNEILIYDLNTHKAFNLNETLSVIYQACDGKTSFNEFQRKNKFTNELIFLGIEELQRNNLVEADTRLDSPLAGMSRREAIRKAGIGSLAALPIITSLVAPTSAMAASGGGGATLGQACTASSQCASSAPSCNGGRCCVGSGSTGSGSNVGSNNAVGIGTTCADPSTADASCNALYSTQCCSGAAVGRACQQASMLARYSCKCA